MTYLLDTDHISILQRRSGPEFPILSARIAQFRAEDLAFSIVSFHEQMIGAHTLINRGRNDQEVTRGYRLLGEILQGFSAAPVLPFDALAIVTFGDLRTRRIRLATMDLRIAAIALSRGFVLVTRNLRDFHRVPGLVVEDWTVPARP